MVPTTLLTLLRMALWRIKRPEGLKEHAPQALGSVLGLDRAPEVKTLRRKLSRLAACGRAADFGRALAQRRVALRGAAIGFLYIDGHVRVYHGQHRLPKTHVARMRLLKGKPRLRQVTRLGEDGHQTPVLSSRRDLPARELADRMFGRWRQENFFQYLREEYALDALADYSVLPDDPQREVPNPAWAAADAKLRQARRNGIGFRPNMAWKPSPAKSARSTSR